MNHADVARCIFHHRSVGRIICQKSWWGSRRLDVELRVVSLNIQLRTLVGFPVVLTQSRTKQIEMDNMQIIGDWYAAFTAVLNNITRSKTARIKNFVNGVVFGTWHHHPRNLILLSKCLSMLFRTHRAPPMSLVPHYWRRPKSEGFHNKPPIA